jgi:hypothetical protein
MHIICKNVVPTVQQTHCIFIVKTTRLRVFKLLFVCENYTENMNALCGSM